MDAREPRHGDELVLQDLVPQVIDRLDLREEAMPADVEPVPLVLRRPRDPAHQLVRFQHGDSHALLRQQVGRRQPAGPGADDHHVIAGTQLIDRARAERPAPLRAVPLGRGPVSGVRLRAQPPEVAQTRADASPVAIDDRNDVPLRLRHPRRPQFRARAARGTRHEAHPRPARPRRFDLRCAPRPRHHDLDARRLEPGEPVQQVGQHECEQRRCRHTTGHGRDADAPVGDDSVGIGPGLAGGRLHEAEPFVELDGSEHVRRVHTELVEAPDHARVPSARAATRARLSTCAAPSFSAGT